MPHGPRLTTELAVRGLAYAGVALVLTGVLGFVIFAFGDVGVAWRPLAEVATVAVLFGSGMFLRRRSAPFVGDALVVLGGLVTPIMLVTAFVDGSSVPPDRTGRALAVVLTPLLLAVAGAYALAVRRRPESPLRFLVAPIVWLAAAAAGLVFATDDPSGQEVVTPLAAQWAVAAVAVTATLWAARRRPQSVLAHPTRVAAFVGLPLAELVVLAAAAAEGWPVLPVLVAGVATFVGIQLLLGDRPLVALDLQGAVIVVTAAACAPSLGAGWSAAAAAGALVALVEVSLHRRPDPTTTVVWLAFAALASVLTLAEPAAALTVGVAGLAWCAFRTEVTPRSLPRSVPTAGAFAYPFLALGAAQMLWSLAWALAGLGVVAVGAAAAVRIRRRDDDLYEVAWVFTQAGLVTMLVLVDWPTLVGEQPPHGLHSVALAAAALALAVVPGWPRLRIWLVAAVALLSGGYLFASLDVPVITGALVAAGLGLAAVAAGQLRATGGGGHVALVGHLTGLGALVVTVSEEAAGALHPADAVTGAVSTALVAMTLGWATSTLVGELRGSVERDLWVRMLAGRAGDPTHWLPADEGRGQVGAVVAPLATLVWSLLVPPTVLVASGVTDVGDPWLPVTALGVAFAGVLAARALVGRRPLLARTWAAGIWIGLVAVPATIGSWWAMFVASTVVVTMALISGPVLGNLATISFGWIASGIGVTALAAALGLPDDSLYLVVFAWASVLLLGTLVADDRRAGRRAPGQVVRRTELWPPFLLGAVAAPLALLPAVDEPRTVAGWCALAGAAVAFAAAGLLRLAWVSTIGWLAATGSVLLLAPWDLSDHPWLLVPLALLLTVAAEGADRVLPPTADAIGPARRWAFPPFVVAHLVAIGALALSASVGWVPATWLGVAALSAVVGLRLRVVWWVVAAVLMAIVGAAVAGPGWLTLALGLTTALCAVTATRATGSFASSSRS